MEDKDRISMTEIVVDDDTFDELEKISKMNKKQSLWYILRNLPSFTFFLFSVKIIPFFRRKWKKFINKKCL